MNINKEKKTVFSEMEETDNNLFISGKAGTGKSYLLKYFKKHTKKSVLYAAPTGVSAINIGGVTLHSIFGFNNLEINQTPKISKKLKQMLQSIDVLVIDEISMVRSDTFDKINLIMKIALNKSAPFGGKQVILFGDLFQLPPIASKEEQIFLKEEYGGVYFFNNICYQNGNFIFRELTEIFRQRDKEFQNVLNNIRVGTVLKEDLALLNQRYMKNIKDNIIQVVPHKYRSNIINESKLKSINTHIYSYKADLVKGSRVNNNDFPCELNLRLKEGSLIMMIANDPQKRWVNGSTGEVVYLDDEIIQVKLGNNKYFVDKTTFTKYKCSFNNSTNKLEYEVDTEIKQYPLILAYAITIHKSQGKTYDKLIVNLQNAFAPGQSYVALSRATSLEGLYLSNPVTFKSIITNKEAIKFYETNKEKNKSL